MGGEPSTINDGLCQGFNNNADCHYDGLDCCRPIIDDSLCSDVLCRCHLSGLRHPSYKDYGCLANIALMGDGICDDDLNSESCFFDKGDCCNPEADKSFCQDCQCLKAPPKIHVQATVQVLACACDADGSQSLTIDEATDANCTQVVAKWIPGASLDQAAFELADLDSNGDIDLQEAYEAIEAIRDVESQKTSYPEGYQLEFENSTHLMQALELMYCACGANNFTLSRQELFHNGDWDVCTVLADNFFDGQKLNENEFNMTDLDGDGVLSTEESYDYLSNGTDVNIRGFLYQDIGACDPSLIGNMECNSINNKEACQFDGGDCCRALVSCPYEYECSRCHLDSKAHRGYSESGDCPALSTNLPIYGKGVCNDELNTRQCFYDNGECCLPNADFSQCQDCICHLYYHKLEAFDKFKWFAQQPTPRRNYYDMFGNAVADHYLRRPNENPPVVPAEWGNGDCDEYMNTPVMLYDGGDCCLPVASRQKFMMHTDYMVYGYLAYSEYGEMEASETKCHQTGSPVYRMGDFESPSCSYVYMNGRCDDFANHQGCFYDGGDCCLAKVNTRDCTDCQCHETQSKHITYAQLGCDEEFLGDGFCDDQFNNLTCGFDGGDCCPFSVPYYYYSQLLDEVTHLINDLYCDECLCKQPDLGFQANVRYPSKFWFFNKNHLRGDQATDFMKLLNTYAANSDLEPNIRSPWALPTNNLVPEAAGISLYEYMLLTDKMGQMDNVEEFLDEYNTWPDAPLYRDADDNRFRPMWATG